MWWRVEYLQKKIVQCSFFRFFVVEHRWSPNSKQIPKLKIVKKKNNKKQKKFFHPTSPGSRMSVTNNERPTSNTHRPPRSQRPKQKAEFNPRSPVLPVPIGSGDQVCDGGCIAGAPRRSTARTGTGVPSARPMAAAHFYRRVRETRSSLQFTLNVTAARPRRSVRPCVRRSSTRDPFSFVVLVASLPRPRLAGALFGFRLRCTHIIFSVVLRLVPCLYFQFCWCVPDYFILFVCLFLD